MKNISGFRILFSIFSLCVIVGLLIYSLKNNGPIYEFNAARDTQEILNLFESDRYWLVSSPDYSPSYMLQNRAPSKDSRYLGKLQLKVLRESNQFIGFTAYYLKNPYEGSVLFVAVKPGLRGKRYGEKLLTFAINDLTKKGAKIIKLVTRPTNKSAQALYKRVGFFETASDEDYVFFSYIPSVSQSPSRQKLPISYAVS